jgi:hypothetical protein
MENKRTGETAQDNITDAMQTAAQAATVKAKLGRKPGEKKNTALLFSI